MPARSFLISLCIILSVLFLFSCQREKMVQDSEGIVKTKLKNGLTVLIKEKPFSATVTLLTRVKAGYTNESDEQIEISHLIEHMSLKGTWKRPGHNDILEQARLLGAQISNWTDTDETGYSMTLPIRYFEQGLELHKDSIFNMKFDPTELSKETEVVIKEIKYKKDDPISFGIDHLKKLIFTKYKLEREKVKTEESLRKLTRNHLLQFFKHYYKPNNVILTIVGGINARETLKAINRYYDSLTPGEIPNDLTSTEPEQTEFRFKRLGGDIKTAYFFTGFPIASASHEDMAALNMISALLTLGQSSRLKNHIRISMEKYHDIIFFNIHGKTNVKSIFDTHKLILYEIEKLKFERVGDKELKKIKTLLDIENLLKQETPFELAKKISFFELYGDYASYRNDFQSLIQMTPQTIQSTAQKYFDLKKCSIFEYVPLLDDQLSLGIPSQAEVFSKLKRHLASLVKKDSKENTEVLTDIPSSYEAISSPIPSIAKNENYPLKRYQLSNNAILLLKEKTEFPPLVALNIFFKGGRLYEYKSISGITQLLLRTSLKGTTTRTQSQIAEKLDQMGALLSTICENDYFGYQLMLPQKHLDEGLKIFSDIIIHPSFLSPILEKEKQELVEELDQEQDIPEPYSYALFREAAFKNHPYGLPTFGFKKSILSITSDKLIQWHSKAINSTDMVVSVVGDFNNLDMRTSMENYFKTIEPRRSDPPTIELTHLPSFISENFRERKKEQTAVFIGFDVVPQTHPDYYALRLMESLISGRGSRFDMRLRSYEKLTHLTSSSFYSYLRGGVFTTYAMTSPEDEKKLLRLLLEEYKKLRDESIDRKELTMAQNSFIGILLASLESRRFQADFYAQNEIYGRSFLDTQEYMNKINSVSADDLNNAALKYFDLESYTLGVIRATHQIQSILSIPPKPISIPKSQKPLTPNLEVKPPTPPTSPSDSMTPPLISPSPPPTP